MIKERTKFYGGLDKNNYMDAVVREFLDENLPTSKVLNKKNAECIMLINTYWEKFVYFSKLTAIIAEFLKKFYGESNYLSNFLKLKSSCKKQSELVSAIKHRTKKVPLDTKYYAAIKFVVSKIEKRLDHLSQNVIYNYLEMTPLLDYMKKLESEGKTLEDDICENIDFSESMYENENVTNYIEKVLSSLEKSNNEYLKRKESYEAFLKHKYAILDEEKDEKKQKSKLIKTEEATKKLQDESKFITEKIFSGRHPVLVQLSPKFMELKNQGYKTGKIVLLAKTITGKRAGVRYLEGEELGTSLGKASVLPITEPLPENIQKQIDSYDLAIVEISIPL